MKPILFYAALLVRAVYAIDAPPMKEGLWSIRMQSTKNPGNKKDDSTKSLCRDHAYDAKAQVAMKEAMTMCKTLHESTSGGVTTIETECSMGGTIVHSKGTVTIINENSTRSETHATYIIPCAKQSASGVGECKAG